MVGKKTHGRKRHIGVDILGLLLHVFCHAANLSDTKQACTVMDRLIDKYPTIQAYAGDGGYRGTAVEYAKTQQNRRFDAVVGLTGPYIPMAKRWVVDRTFGWMSHSRRLVRDYEIIPGNSENMVRISMVKIMLAKLS